MKNLSLFLLVLVCVFILTACDEKPANTDPLEWSTTNNVDETDHNSNEQQTSLNETAVPDDTITADKLRLDIQTSEDFRADEYHFKSFTDELCKAKELIKVDHQVEFGPTVYTLYVVNSFRGIFKLSFQVSSEFDKTKIYFNDIGQGVISKYGYDVENIKMPIWYDCWIKHVIDDKDYTISISTTEASSSDYKAYEDKAIYELNGTVGYLKDNQYIIPIAMEKYVEINLIIDFENEATIDEAAKIKLVGFEKVSDFENGFDMYAPNQILYTQPNGNHSIKGSWVNIHYAGDDGNFIFRSLSDYDRLDCTVRMNITKGENKGTISFVLGNTNENNIEAYTLIHENDNYTLYRYDWSSYRVDYYAFPKDPTQYADFNIFINVDTDDFITDEDVIVALEKLEFKVHMIYGLEM